MMASLLLVLALMAPLGMAPPRHTPPQKRATAKHLRHTAKKTTARRHRGARRTREHVAAGISAERATEIQQALMQAGYLKQSSGHWDAATAAAMKKYQADHHWQTRFVPDAKALLALGLVHAQPTQTADNH